MAAPTTPLILGPDGVLRDSAWFSTTLPTRFFYGTTDGTTVDVEVSVRGGAYTRDATLVAFEGTTWRIPNPEFYQDGLTLEAGENVILVRAVSTTGEVSAPAKVSVRSVRASDVSLVAVPPTAIRVEQLDGSVRILSRIDGDASSLRGVNFYASTSPGGGASGYSRLNVEPVSSPQEEEEEEEVGTLESDVLVARDADGALLSDPQYLAFPTVQQDATGIQVGDGSDDQVAVPLTATTLRYRVAVTSVKTVRQYVFEHSRTATTRSEPPTIFVGAFAATPGSEPLYYVASATYYDASAFVEVESPYSTEVVARPLTITTSPGTFPLVTRQGIVRETVLSITRTNRQVRVDPGSVLRDVFIDPFAAEAERIRFLVDFLHQAQSFSGLVSIDDPSGTGSSSPVGTTAYKQALKKTLNLSKDSDVQAVIDRAFESLAQNFGITRLSGRFARGEVTFYTSRQPTREIIIPLGSVVAGGSVEFRVMSASRLTTYFNPATRRYQVTVPVQAIQVGPEGNVARGQVRRVVSGVTGLSVINESDMAGGQGQESNLALATRAQNALASVDAGTERGYYQTASGVPGVLKVEVVPAGHDLMMRDMDASGVHRGGKVDVWVQGETLSTVSESFAFELNVARDVQFVLIGDPADLTFRAVDVSLSATRPIVALVDGSLRNATQGVPYDLTGSTLVRYDTIALSSDVPQPVTSFDDVILGDYRSQAGNTFEFGRQPVRDIISVVGSSSGTLPATSYQLVRNSDPLVVGRSEIAQDYLEIVREDVEGVMTPSGTQTQVTGEAHVLRGEYLEYLNNRGVDVLSIVVRSSDGMTTYRGPDDASGESDYSIQDGSSTTAPAIFRTSDGNIPSGTSVLVDYSHAENFAVTYRTNSLVSYAQARIDAHRHATADVLVKEAVQVPVDISATVVLMRRASQEAANKAIQTNFANFFAARRTDEPVRQSDVIALFDNTQGVSHVTVPLTKMVRQEGSLVVREALPTDQTGDTTYLRGWSSRVVSVWLIERELGAATTDNGGNDDEYRSVFQDGIPMILVTSSPSTAMRVGAGRSYIIGAGGATILSFSDDDTLLAQGYTTPQSRERRRVELTANRVVVSTSVDQSPTGHSYAVTYVVGDDSGAKDIDPGRASYVTLGNLDLTFDEEGR